MTSHLAGRSAARRLLAIVSASALAVVLIPATGHAATPSSKGGGRSAISGSSPGWTTRATVIGAPAASARISFNVVLPLRHAADAAQLADNVSNPKSSSYGRYLTATQFNTAYAPTARQVRSVEAYLSSQGLSVSSVAQGNRWVTATGTVSQVETAFGAPLKNYRYHGRTLRASTGSLTLPAGIAPLVSGVLGVSQSASVRKPDLSTTTSQTESSSPSDAQPPASICSTYWDQHEQSAPLAYAKTSFPTPGCGYSPAQLRGAYNLQSAVSHGTDGRGITVAIIDAYASPTMLADSNTLSDLQGEPRFKTGQYTETAMTPFMNQDECGGEAGWNEEESLDVEAVHGLAPGANVHYVGASDCDTGIDTAVNYVLQNHTADIVSNSYGFAGEDGLGAEVALEHSQFIQAAAEGIGFYFSSGDNGDNVILGAPHPEPDYPASDTMVTGVGGTSLAVTHSKGYKFETPWGDDLASVNFATSPSSYSTTPPGPFLFGGGGGVSALFTQPSYQRLAVPKSLAKLNGSTAMRVVPDVAAVADPETGYLIVVGGQQVQIGGTSLAVPVFAGVQALASQHRRFPIGFANPLLYLLGLTGVAFHDVTAPKNTVAIVTASGRSLLTLGKDSSLTGTKGYDDTTGLGTPNGPLLLLGETVLP